jgi:GTP-binding protein
LAELQETAERMLPQVRGTPLVTLSAETGRGVDRLMPAVFKTYQNWSAKVKTRDLNDWLALATQRHPPPAVNGRRIKPKYMAQLKGRPPTFVLMASRAEHLPEQYKRYLVNSLRESFDLPGVPIRIFIKANKNPYADEADGNRSVKNAPKFPVKRKSAAEPTLGDDGEPLPKRAMNRAAAQGVEPPPAPAAPKSFRVRKPSGVEARKAASAAKPSAKKAAAARGKATRTQQRVPTTNKLRKPKAPRKSPSRPSASRSPRSPGSKR